MKTDFVIPQINNNDQEVIVTRWLVDDFAWIEAGQDIVEVETTKSVVSLQANVKGFVRHVVREGQTIEVLAVAAVISETKEEASTVAQPSLPKNTQSPVEITRFSQSARQYIQSHSLRESDYSGLGLVTLRVVQGRVEPISRSKLGEIESLAIGQRDVLSSSLTVNYDSSGIRKQLERDGTTHGLILPVIIFEVARLVKESPKFAAYFDNQSIHYYDRVDLGVAMDMDQGLKVLTLAAADTLTPGEITEKLLDMSIAYAENRIPLEYLQESTFTITDLSHYGIAHFVPLINGRQSGILGIGESSITLTFDHRVLSGKEVALFLGELRTRLMAYVPRMSEDVHCDRCLMDIRTYHEKFSRDAVMQLFARPGGGVGYICHICSSGLY